jgi:nitric oxide reductase large subunit
MQIEVFCNETINAENPVIKFDNLEGKASACNPKINVYTPHGCKITKAGAFNNFFEAYWWMFSIAFIAFGLYTMNPKTQNCTHQKTLNPV